MTLTPEQANAIRQWVAEGESLSAIQNHLRADFGLHPTFFDVRMAVMELGLQVKNKVAQVAADDVTKAKLPPKPTVDGALPTPPDPPAAGDVTVSVDTIQAIPGAIVSGSATFSDGTKARWFFDQMGRFAFEPELPGYQPTPEDSRAFQQKLQAALASRGY